MKKTLSSLMTLLAATGLLAFASCNKDEQEGVMEFKATMEDCTDTDGKTELRGTRLYWSPGDEIRVFGRQGSAIFATSANTSSSWTSFRRTEAIGTGPFDGPYRAFYPADITTDGQHVTLPMVQHSEDGSLDHDFPMYAQTTASDVLKFKNLCGVLRISLFKPNVNVKKIKIVANTNINGVYEVSYDHHIPEMTYITNGSKRTWLECSTAQSIDSWKYFYVYLPEGAYSNLKVVIYTDDYRYCEKTAKNNVVVNCRRSQTTDIMFGAGDLNFVALPGLFSISATQQVRIAPGNLQYQASTDTWRFAEHQWDYVGDASAGNVYEHGVKCNNNLISATYTGWIDIFNWGTGNNPTFHENRIGEYGVGSLPLTYHTFVDWGTNAIVNGAGQPDMWRTPAQEEWGYMLVGRRNWESKLGQAVVNGVNGFIVLPDNWVLPSGLTFVDMITGWTTSIYGWTANIYTVDQWDEMEARGAVFFPAAGIRDVYNVFGSVGDFGLYWSSSSILASELATLVGENLEEVVDIALMYAIAFTAEGVILNTESEYYYLAPMRIGHYMGGSVRLVQDVVDED